MVPASFSVLMLLLGVLIGYAVGRLAVTKLNKTRTKNVMLAGLIFVMLLGSVWQGYVQNRETERISECSARYANELSVALDARFDAADAESRALTEWLQATYDALNVPSPGAGQRIRAALERLLHARADARAQRGTTPYPEPPGQACPEVSP